MPESTPRDENMIAALKRERAAYVALGDQDRAAQVDEQLLYYGYQPAGQGPAIGAPDGRTAPGGQSTADADRAPGAAAKTEAAPPTPPTPAPTTTAGAKKPAVKKTAAAKTAQAPAAPPAPSSEA